MDGRSRSSARSDMQHLARCKSVSCPARAGVLSRDRHAAIAKDRAGAPEPGQQQIACRIDGWTMDLYERPGAGAARVIYEFSALAEARERGHPQMLVDF